MPQQHDWALPVPHSTWYHWQHCVTSAYRQATDRVWSSVAALIHTQVAVSLLKLYTKVQLAVQYHQGIHLLILVLDPLNPLLQLPVFFFHTGGMTPVSSS